MMQSVSRGDIFRRLRQVGIAGQVQASQAVEAFRLYLQSEFPDMTAEDCTPLFVRDHVLVVRSVNPAMMQTLRNRETEIVRFIADACGQRVDRVQFRAS